MSKTYTEAEVKSMVSQALRPFTSEAKAKEIAEHVITPSLHSPEIETVRKGVYALRAKDKEGKKWYIAEFSAKGVYLAGSVGAEDWELNEDGELTLVLEENNL